MIHTYELSNPDTRILKGGNIDDQLIEDVKDCKICFLPRSKDGHAYMNQLKKYVHVTELHNGGISLSADDFKNIEQAWDGLIIDRPSFCERSSIPMKLDIDGIGLHLGSYPVIVHSIMSFIEDYFHGGYPNGLKDKKVAVINRTHRLGIPLASELLARDATVTIMHSQTDLETYESVLGESDVIVTATGNMLGDYVSDKRIDFHNLMTLKHGVLIIDAGTRYRKINTCPNEVLCGDVGWAEIYDSETDEMIHQIPSNIGGFTPCPGGVGKRTLKLILERIEQRKWCKYE